MYHRHGRTIANKLEVVTPTTLMVGFTSMPVGVILMVEYVSMLEGVTLSVGVAPIVEFESMLVGITPIVEFGRIKCEGSQSLYAA